MVATFVNVTEEILKMLILYFQIITCVVILKQLFASGSVKIHFAFNE